MEQRFNEDFIKNYNKESDEEYLLEGNVQHHEKLHELHNDLLFLLERVKTEKVKKPVANLPGKTEYVTHKRNLNLALNYELFFKKVHREDEVSQNVWIKPYIDMNKDLRKKNKKIILKKIFLS